MRNSLKALRHDEFGAIGTSELIIITSIVCICGIIALSDIRIALVQELGDVSVALERLDQSYSASIGTVEMVYNDEVTLQDSAGDPPGGLCITVAVHEN